MDELQRQLKAFSKRYGFQGQMMKARIEILMKQGKSPEEAIRQVFKEYGVEDWLQANVSSVIVGTAQNALGQEMARDLPAAALLEVLSNPWDGSGLTLSEKIHGASNTMLNDVITTVRKQIHLNKTVKDTAQALYDGYRNGHVVRQQELPKYMDELTRWTRRSRENLSEAEVKDLQRAIRKVRAQAEGLVDDSSTYNHFRTALNSLFDKLDQGSEKAAEKALQAAIEEKSRYVAERIARTEAARARYDAFIARYGEDDSVVAYQWKLGSRHPAEDICDMYAHADLYGLGAGVFPKNLEPVNPAHPHCLCHYAPVYASELKGKKRSDNVEGRGNAWLKRQPLHIRQAILGVKGEQEWKAGRAGWMEKARNLNIQIGGYYGIGSRIINFLKLKVGKISSMEYNERRSLDSIPRINRKLSFIENLKETNKNYNEGPEYQANCQRAVPTFELRLRGYDVLAKPGTLRDQSDYLSLARDPFGAFWNVDVITCNPAYDNGKQEITDALKKWGNGARAEIAFKPFGDDPGHVIMGLNQNGEIQFVDPQKGEANYQYYFSYRGKISVEFGRIDKAGINLDRLTEICEWRGL